MGKKNQILSLFVASLIFVGLIVSGLPIQTQAAPTACGDLFISEYIEGSSYNKSIEIYNGTGSSVDLSTYTLELYSNGSASVSASMALSGNVIDGDVIVISHGSAGATIQAQTDLTNSSVINFNGDDALVLKNNGSVIDVIGQVGFDPGSEWGSGTISTQDNTLRRQSTVGAGDTNESDAFDPATEWDGYAVDTFDGLGSHTTTGCDVSDTAPTVSSTSPTDGATGVAVDMDITINFSESVDLTTSAVILDCGGAISFSGLPANDVSSVTLTPDSDLPESTTCDVNVVADQVSDNDVPIDEMASDYGWSFATANPAPDIIINEVDADTEGTDALEFVELYDGGLGNTTLDGLVLVFYNGSDDASYYALNLDSQQTNAIGYFVVGNSGVSNVDLVFNGNTLQNGADAVAIYQGDSVDFPNGTAVTTSNLIDAIVYDTSDADDAGLLVLLNAGQPQVNENGNGSGAFESNQRCPNGEGGARNTSSYLQGTPSPGLTNSACAGEIAPTVSSTNPANGASGVLVDSNIVINFSENVNVTGSWYNIDCPSSGVHSASVSGGPQSFTLNPDTDFMTNETCAVTIYAAQVTDQDTDDPPDVMEADYGFYFSTEGSPPACSTIPLIQGTVNTSGCLGHRDNIEGCITGVTATGIYFQDLSGDDNPASSDGIFAYFWSTWDNPSNLQPGDLVSVSGNVTEYYDTTEFANSGSDPLSVSEIGSCTVPAPVSVIPNLDPTADPMTLYERYEGMRVQMTFDGWVVGPTKRFDSRYMYGDPEIAFVDFGSTISDYSRVFQSDYPGYQGINYLSGGLNFDLPNLDFGDDIAGTDITGVLGYQFDKYTLLVDAAPTLVTTDNPDTIEPQIAADSAKLEFDICYYNVENLFDNLNDGSGDWGDWAPGYPIPGTPEGAAEYLAHLNENAAVLFNDAKSCMVIGLEEVEGKQGIYDDLATALSGLDSGYNWTGIYVESGDARDISQGFLYRDDVTLVSGPTSVSGTPYTTWVSDGTLDFRRVPAAATFRFFAETATQVDITAYAVHFKSKGSSTLCSTPDCTDVRELEAADLRDILSHHQGNLEYAVAGGDFNDYINSSPIIILNASSDIHNLFTDLPANEQYSYIFSGESEILDYIFITQNMLFNNGFMWNRTFNPIHVNADFPASEHASDHDPVRVRFLGSDLSDLAASYAEAWHTIPHLITLGNSISNDADGTVAGDDASDTGVSIVSGTWSPGQTVVIQVDVQADASYPDSTAWFSGWFDWNLNGAFESSERAINQVVNIGQNTIYIMVPLDAQIGSGSAENAYMPVRFRLYESTIEPLSASVPVLPLAAELSGGVAGGEVEDYIWGFTPNAISLQNFDGQAHPMDWMSVVMIIAGLSAVSLWGWRHLQKEKHST